MKIEDVYEKLQGYLIAAEMTAEEYPESKDAKSDLEEARILADAVGKRVLKEVEKTPDSHRYGACPICGRVYWDKCHIGNYCDSCGQALKEVGQDD